MWSEAAVAYFGALSKHFLLRTMETHKKNYEALFYARMFYTFLIYGL
jgi:hypothetical protein